MLYAYGIICFLECLMMALGIGRGRIFNFIAFGLANVAFFSLLYDHFGNLSGSIWFYAIAQAVVMTANFVIAMKKTENK